MKIYEIKLQDCSAENGTSNDCDCKRHWWCEELAPLGNHWVRPHKILNGEARLGVCFTCSTNDDTLSKVT